MSMNMVMRHSKHIDQESDWGARRTKGVGNREKGRS
jgi:hypothetical protein